MGQAISRDFVWVEVILTTDATTTPWINVPGYAYGRVYVPANSSITTLTYYDSPAVEGLDAPNKAYSDANYTAFDSNGVAVTQTVAAGRSYPYPSAMAGAGKVRITGNAAGTIYIGFKG